MICELYPRTSRLPWKPKGLSGWSFRLIYRNGARPNDVYRDATDAKRGARDLIDAIRSEGDGIEFRVVDR